LVHLLFAAALLVASASASHAQSVAPRGGHAGREPADDLRDSTPIPF
jgi:hypothetical protein